MTEQKFTSEQMQAAHMAGQTTLSNLDFNSSNWVARKYVENLALPESKWMPANKQVYKNPDGKYYKQEEGFKCNPNSRPLTLSEVGKEPVQHLVDGLTLIVSHQLPTNAATLMALAQTALDKHKELMK